MQIKSFLSMLVCIAALILDISNLYAAADVPNTPTTGAANHDSFISPIPPTDAGQDSNPDAW